MSRSVPLSYGYAGRPKGYCVLCREPILEHRTGEQLMGREPPGLTRRKRWHTACGWIWLFMTSSTEQRRFLRVRDQGVCRVCREPVNLCYVEWEADHIYPLWLVDRTLPLAYRYWMPQNMQTLCRAHHVAKSAQEAKQRAKVKRLQAGPREPQFKLQSRGFQGSRSFAAKHSMRTRT